MTVSFLSKSLQYPSILDNFFKIMFGTCSLFRVSNVWSLIDQTFDQKTELTLQQTFMEK